MFDKATKKAWVDMAPTVLLALILLLAFWFSSDGMYVVATSNPDSLGVSRMMAANFMLLLAVLFAVWMLPIRLKALKDKK